MSVALAAKVDWQLGKALGFVTHAIVVLVYGLGVASGTRGRVTILI